MPKNRVDTKAIFLPKLAVFYYNPTVMASPNMSPDSDTAQGKPELFTFELFERAAKITIVIVGVLYGLGLLITNTYLASIGVSDFSSIKPKYIITGAWSFLILLLAALPSVFFVLGWQQFKGTKIKLNHTSCLRQISAPPALSFSRQCFTDHFKQNRARPAR